MNSFLYLLLSVLLLKSIASANNKTASIRDIGQIEFIERKWTLGFDLNLQAYLDNAVVLEDASSKLTNICNRRQNDVNCKYFELNIKRDTEAVERDVAYVFTHRRYRRNILINIFGKILLKHIPIAVGTAIITNSIVKSDTEELEEKLSGQDRLLRSIMRLQVDHSETTLAMSKKILDLEQKVNSINETAVENEKFQELLHIAEQSVSKHTLETNFFLKILTGDFRTYFFRIIDL